jgi:transcriptional regulator with XRE-family HTH domain
LSRRAGSGPPSPKPHPIDLHLGGRLRLARKQCGVTQGTLAQALSVSFQQVQKYERGTNRLSGASLYGAAITLGVAPAFFFEGLAGLEAGPVGDVKG